MLTNDPTQTYPVWGESSAAIQPQLYNWAQQDYANQHANIAGRVAVDQQAIQNANNYFQQKQAIEAQDYARQSQADDEARKIAQAQANAAEHRYEFGKQIELSQADLARRAHEDALRFGPPSASELDQQVGAALGNALAKRQINLDESPDILAKRFGTTPEHISGFIAQAKPAYAREIEAALNTKVENALMHVKPGMPLPLDALEGLTATAPQWLRKDLYFDRDLKQFRILPPAKPAESGMGNARIVQGYNFSDRTPTATATGADVAPSYGNMGGGYFAPTPTPKAQAVIAPPPAPVAPPAPSMPQVKSQADIDKIVRLANEAISKGKDRSAVLQWAKQMGVELKFGQ